MDSGFLKVQVWQIGSNYQISNTFYFANLLGISMYRDTKSGVLKNSLLKNSTIDISNNQEAIKNIIHIDE